MKRLKSILSLNVKKPTHIYDLYTDHGKIGIALSNQFQNSFLSFIDIRDHLIKDLEKKYLSNDLYRFITQDANLTILEDNSLVLMCGVGGNLIISCLQNYLKQDNIASQEFLICATMHTLEIRKFLQENKFTQKDSIVANENGRCYEVMLVSRTKSYSPIEIFAPLEWDLSHPVHNRYLRSKIKSLEDKYSKENWELKTLNEIINFIDGK